MKHHVFITVSYEVFNLPGFFDQLYNFIGYFHIQQSIMQSHDRVFEIWFWTDLVEIKEGELRQVDMLCKMQDDQKTISFTINKI